MPKKVAIKSEIILTVGERKTSVLSALPAISAQREGVVFFYIGETPFILYTSIVYFGQFQCTYIHSYAFCVPFI